MGGDMEAQLGKIAMELDVENLDTTCAITS